MPPIRVKTITEAHRLLQLPSPEHPLISLLNYTDLNAIEFEGELSAVFEFYYISLKKGFTNKLFYGQQTYDFDEGMMYFVAPNQVLRGAGPDPADDLSGWILLIHPDLLWGHPLATSITKYEYFDYRVNEALFLSDKEKNIVNGIVQNIQTEYQSNMDKFSQDILISHLETLLNYSERFYQRQFLTRKKTNHQLLAQVDGLLAEYMSSDSANHEGLPSVQFLSDRLNVSAKYLSSMLKQLTGLSAQQHIHEKMIAKAKEMLSTTSLSVSEIAYELGFEHSQSFSKLFKAKTSQSPVEFRAGFQSN